jgi:hypothetical protein
MRVLLEPLKHSKSSQDLTFSGYPVSGSQKPLME